MGHLLSSLGWDKKKIKKCFSFFFFLFSGAIEILDFRGGIKLSINFKKSLSRENIQDVEPRSNPWWDDLSRIITSKLTDTLTLLLVLIFLMTSRTMIHAPVAPRSKSGKRL